MFRTGHQVQNKEAGHRHDFDNKSGTTRKQRFTREHNQYIYEHATAVRVNSTVAIVLIAAEAKAVRPTRQAFRLVCIESITENIIQRIVEKKL